MLRLLASRLLSALPRACLFLFVAACLYLINELALGFRWPGDGAGWPDAALVIFATATTMCSTARRLPWQNVLLATAIIAVIGALTVWPMVSGIWHPASGIGHLIFPPESEPRLLSTLPWAIPFIWVIVVLNSRGVAQLVLRRRRGAANFGLEMFGTTAALVVLFLLCIHPFGIWVEIYWAWAGGPIAFCGAPLWAFAVSLGVTALTLIAVTPVLLDKRPDGPPANFQPLVVWISLNAVFATGSTAHGLWMAAGLQIGATILAAVLAVRGARQSRLPARPI